MILFYLQAVWRYIEMETFHLCIDDYEEQVIDYHKWYKQISITHSQRNVGFVWFFIDEALVSLFF